MSNVPPSPATPPQPPADPAPVHPVAALAAAVAVATPVAIFANWDVATYVLLTILGTLTGPREK